MSTISQRVRIENASPWLLVGCANHYTITTTLLAIERSVRLLVSRGVPPHFIVQEHVYIMGTEIETTTKEMSGNLFSRESNPGVLVTSQMPYH